jgi:hypothetical protein
MDAEYKMNDVFKIKDILMQTWIGVAYDRPTKGLWKTCLDSMLLQALGYSPLS